MTRHLGPPLRTAALAGAIAGVALWCTRGVVDLIATSAGPVRVAMLPPLWALALLVVLGVAAALALAYGLTRLEA
jgi:hypothetical protein